LPFPLSALDVARMKTARILTILLSLSGGLTAPLSAQTRAQPSDVVVELTPEATALAQGFAQAFEALPHGAKYIEVSTPEGGKFLEGSIRSVQAFEGVLLIQSERGFLYAVNAERILSLTTLKPAS